MNDWYPPFHPFEEQVPDQALIWDAGNFSEWMRLQAGWLVIDSEEQYARIRHRNFRRVVLLLELGWNGSPPFCLLGARKLLELRCECLYLSTCIVVVTISPLTLLARSSALTYSLVGSLANAVVEFPLGWKDVVQNAPDGWACKALDVLTYLLFRCGARHGSVEELLYRFCNMLEGVLHGASGKLQAWWTHVIAPVTAKVLHCYQQAQLATPSLHHPLMQQEFVFSEISFLHDCIEAEINRLQLVALAGKKESVKIIAGEIIQMVEAMRQCFLTLEKAAQSPQEIICP
ncbi:MAG: hypothetical protein AAB316_04735 [Bacteroidota bacterium]